MYAVEDYVGFAVNIMNGTFAINNKVYSVKQSSVVMTEPSTIIMTEPSDALMTENIGVRILSPPPAEGYFRYDMFVVSTDGIIDYIEGTPSATSPQMPETPIDHIKLHHALIVGGDTYLKSIYINYTFETPYPASFEASPVFSTIYYSLDSEEETAEVTEDSLVTITVKNQYDKPISGNHILNLEKNIWYGYFIYWNNTSN